MKIEGAQLSDGGARLVLANQDIVNPSALAIDYKEKVCNLAFKVLERF